MSCIRGKNTTPEITMRKILSSHGVRYRIHDKHIFGTPDISNKSKNLVVFIDGCFWHGCDKCYKEPGTNTDFWRKKITRNRERRKEVRTHLSRNGWVILEFWEHEINKKPEHVTKKILKYF